MSNHWLEISDDELDAEEIERQVRERIARRMVGTGAQEDPEAVAEALWQEMIGSGAEGAAPGQGLSLADADCDIVPRQYAIDWRTPVLGPIHARVRRIINAEIRRYLLPSLEKQSYLNRQMVSALNELRAENERLRQEIEQLRAAGA
jgi:hypothetical protein